MWCRQCAPEDLCLTKVAALPVRGAGGFVRRKRAGTGGEQGYDTQEKNDAANHRVSGLFL